MSLQFSFCLGGGSGEGRAGSGGSGGVEGQPVWTLQPELSWISPLTCNTLGHRTPHQRYENRLKKKKLAKHFGSLEEGSWGWKLYHYSH